ncbi:MAG: sugar phosphate nucleotidyltransferase [Lentisphaeria bacterium]
MPKPTVIILAAGLGSRYGGFKQIAPVGDHGEIALDYAVHDAWRAGFGKAVFVLRRELEKPVRDHFAGKLPAGFGVEVVFQELADLPAGFKLSASRSKPWGTGHAIRAARHAVQEPFAVINADDFYGAESYEVLGDFLRRQPAASTRPHPFAMVGFPLRRTLSKFGTVSRGVCRLDGEGFLQGVVEHPKIADSPAGIRNANPDGGFTPLPEETVVSMNMWGFTPAIFPHLDRLFVEFLHEHAHDPKAEFYIPSVADRLVREGEATVKVLRTGDAWFGMTYPEDRPEVVANIRALTVAGRYPQPLWGENS